MIYLASLSIALAVAALEAVSYLGFIEKHIGLSAYIFYFLSILAAVWTKKEQKRMHYLLKVCASAAAAVFLVLSFLEQFMYQNFVYSAVHINLAGFQFLLGLLIVHAVLSGDSGRRVVEKLAMSLIAGLLISTGVGGLGRTAGFAVRGIGEVVRDPFASYDKKMEKAYPGFYPAMKEVVRLTPEDAVLYIPPQTNPWEYEGNAALVRYFIYPRIAVNFPANGTTGVTERPAYVLIAKGSWKELTGSMAYGWPKMAVFTDRLWKFDVNAGTSETFARSYDPSLDQWDWGLIEVKQ